MSTFIVTNVCKPWGEYIKKIKFSRVFIVLFLNFQLEIVGLNRKNYETRRRVVHMNVQEKPGKEILFFSHYVIFCP